MWFGIRQLQGQIPLCELNLFQKTEMHFIDGSTWFSAPLY